MSTAEIIARHYNTGIAMGNFLSQDPMEKWTRSVSSAKRTEPAGLGFLSGPRTPKEVYAEFMGRLFELATEDPGSRLGYAGKFEAFSILQLSGFSKIETLLKVITLLGNRFIILLDLNEKMSKTLVGSYFAIFSSCFAVMFARDVPEEFAAWVLAQKLLGRTFDITHLKINNLRILFDEESLVNDVLTVFPKLRCVEFEGSEVPSEPEVRPGLISTQKVVKLFGDGSRPFDV